MYKTKFPLLFKKVKVSINLGSRSSHKLWSSLWIFFSSYLILMSQGSSRENDESVIYYEDWRIFMVSIQRHRFALKDTWRDCSKLLVYCWLPNSIPLPSLSLSPPIPSLSHNQSCTGLRKGWRKTLYAL